METGARMTNRVKEMRTARGLRQADLAREVGITRQTVIAIEKGRLTPSVLIALKLAAVLGEPVEVLFSVALEGAASGGTFEIMAQPDLDGIAPGADANAAPDKGAEEETSSTQGFWDFV